MEISLGPLRVVAAPEQFPPFEPEAVAAEEDTYLVLSADPTVREPEEHLLEVLTAVAEAEPVDPGEVVVRSGLPLRLLAVVHDLGEDPSWREEWIAEALDALLREVGKRGLESLALPMLGTVHGRLPVQRFADLLRSSLRRVALGRLRRLWLVAPDDRCHEVLAALTFEDV